MAVRTRKEIPEKRNKSASMTRRNVACGAFSKLKR